MRIVLYYGRGFYLTEEPELAKEWACAKKKDGFLNKYEMDMENLAILNLNNEKYNVLNWLALLAKHRTYWQRGSIAEEAKQYIQKHFLLDVSAYEYYKKKATRDRQARKEYRQSIKKSSYKNELYILDIMREGIENGDARLL